HFRRTPSGRFEDRVDEARLACRRGAARLRRAVAVARMERSKIRERSDLAQPGLRFASSGLQSTQGIDRDQTLSRASMSRQSIPPVVAAALIGVAWPARAQPADFPDGPGKETFVAQCGACHDINRARAGYTATGWRTVMRMMLNFGVPIPPDEIRAL